MSIGGVARVPGKKYQYSHGGPERPWDISLTKQADAKDADINNIVNTYMKTGRLPIEKFKEMKFVDAISVPDFRDAMEIVTTAQDRFAELPAQIRNRFENQPERLISFMNDPNNYDEALTLGLVEPRRVVDSMQSEKVSKKAADTADKKGDQK